MSRNRLFFFAIAMISLATVTCQVIGSPVSTPTTEPMRPATDLPLFTIPTPTVSAGDDLHTIFPSFSLIDPNTVCVAHVYYALSCVDASGWHVYKNEYDEVSHPRSTIPNRVYGCPDGRIYLVGDTIYRVEGEALIDIGGYVDLGTLACGGGNEIWVSDFSEVSRFDGSTWTSYSVDEYFESHDDEWPDAIYSLAIAPDGNAWVITNNTIATFDGSEWEVLMPPGNYRFDESNDLNHGLAIDSSGAVWIIAYPEPCCTDGQLLKFDGVEWSTFPGPDEEMHSIVVDNRNRIWASTSGNKIFMLNPDTNEWELRFDEEQLGLGYDGGNRLRQMEFDGQGRLWAATNYGLGIYDGVTWTIYHSYTADLYMNNISLLSVLGDGPPLPALKLKPFGSIRGKLVSETQASFADALVYICIVQDPGPGVCANQADKVNADGSFIISNVPAGTYTLGFKISGKRYDLVSKENAYLSYPPGSSSRSLSFTVKEGEETQLGEISAP